MKKGTYEDQIRIEELEVYAHHGVYPEENEKGLIVPRFGNKPENHVAVSMTFDSLSELLLMTKTHYEAWLSAYYAASFKTQSNSKPRQTAESPQSFDSII